MLKHNSLFKALASYFPFHFFGLSIKNKAEPCCQKPLWLKTEHKYNFV